MNARFLKPTENVEPTIYRQRPSVLDLIPQADANPSSTHLRSKPDVTLSGDVTQGRVDCACASEIEGDQTRRLPPRFSRRIASDKHRTLYTSSTHSTGVTVESEGHKGWIKTSDDQSETFVASSTLQSDQ